MNERASQGEDFEVLFQNKKLGLAAEEFVLSTKKVPHIAKLVIFKFNNSALRFYAVWENSEVKDSPLTQNLWQKAFMGKGFNLLDIPAVIAYTESEFGALEQRDNKEEVFRWQRESA